jgi:FkbM family methyltransferase
MGLKKILDTFYIKITSKRNLFQLRKLGVGWKELNLIAKNKQIKKSTLFGRKIKISDNFWYLFGLREIFIDHTYKFNSSNESPLIIDCGSNIGLSVIYFKQMYPKSKVICFEPDNEIFEMLKYNVELFNFKNIEFHKAAVWTTDGEISFASDGKVGGHISSIESEESNINKIKSFRLNNILNQKVDFLKIDIEGAEYELLKDCKDNLNLVENIFIEYHSFHETEQMLPELLQILKQAGFRVYIKEAWENMMQPFCEKKGPFYDLQLNIYGYRK